jgi:hypothetical protein
MRAALKSLEVRAGIEPASADLQSDASPLCHRTPDAGFGARNNGNPPPAIPGQLISECPGLIQATAFFVIARFVPGGSAMHSAAPGWSGRSRTQRNHVRGAVPWRAWGSGPGGAGWRVAANAAQAEIA